MRFKPNVDLIRKEAEASKNRSNFENKDIKWYDWKTAGPKSDGVNYIRLLPPFNEKGELFKSVYNWYVPQNLDIKGVRHLTRTWPDSFNEDFMEEVVARAKKEFPELENLEPLKSFYPKLKVYANVIDRKNPGNGPCVIGLSPKVYGWIIENMSDMLSSGGDPTDVINGVDLKIIRDPKSQGWYTCTFLGTTTADEFIPLTSPLAVNKDNSPNMELIDQWCDNLYDLHAIFSPPKDKLLSMYKESADKFWSYLTNQAVELNRGSNNPIMTQFNHPQVPQVPATQVPQMQVPKVPVTQVPSNAEQAKAYLQNNLPAPTIPDVSSSAIKNILPTDKPECFGKRVEGTAKCMQCPYEFDCDVS